MAEEEPDNEMDITQIQEEEDTSMEESTESSFDLQAEMALRKKLDLKFADTEEEVSSFGKPSTSRSTGSNDSSSSIQSKISLFEQKVTENNKSHQNGKPVVFKPPLAPSGSFAVPVTRGASSSSSEVPAANAAPTKRESKKFKVFLRLRPCSNAEESVVKVVPSENKPVNGSGDPPTKIRVCPPSSLVSKQDKDSNRFKSVDGNVKEFCFQQVFDESSTQAEVYNRTAAPLVNQLCSGNRVGQSSLLFSYGITNAGKTYTILGNLARSKKRSQPQRAMEQQDDWGIVPRCLKQVLQKVSNTDLKVSLSFFEIYNENVYDLLPTTTKTNPTFGGPPALKLREQKGKTVIKGLNNICIETMEQGMEIVLKAKERRHNSNNQVNRHSSRSHCVCQITVSAGPHSDDSSVDSTSHTPSSATLWVVDLAGSERSKRTHASNQKESAFINKSLLTLGGCLTRGLKNYRESKLTTLFMHHWMRNGTTSIIVNVHPTAEDYDETQHVLAYAVQAKTIPNPERRTLPTAAVAKTGNGSKIRMEKKRPAAFKPASLSLPSPNVKIPRKRKTTEASSNEISTKAPPARHGGAEVSHRSKRMKPDSQIEKSKKPSSSVADLKQELAQAKQQIEALQAENANMETVLRAEIAEEIQGKISAMSERYEGTIRELKNQEAASLEKMNKAEQKTSACEEEMARMTETFAEKTNANQALLEQRDQRIAQLEAQLKESERSKEEIVKNMELLNESGETEDDDDEEEATKTPPRREPVGHYQKPLKFATEPRVRRKLDIGAQKEKENNTVPKNNTEETTNIRKPLSNTTANLS